MITVADMIVRVRRETRNATTGSTTAGASIDDAEFVDRLNDGQELCVELISGVFANLFERTQIYTIDTSVANYEVLDLPDRLLLGTRIVSAEYSYDGTAKNYANIYPLDIRERYTGSSYQRSLLGYILSGNNIILSEIPSQNGAKVRVVFEQRPLRLGLVAVPDEVATTSELPDYCEKFMIAYAVMEMFGRDGSKLAKAAESRFSRIESSLIKNYIQATRDWPAVPETRY